MTFNSIDWRSGQLSVTNSLERILRSENQRDRRNEISVAALILNEEDSYRVWINVNLLTIVNTRTQVLHLKCIYQINLFQLKQTSCNYNNSRPAASLKRYVFPTEMLGF